MNNPNLPNKEIKVGVGTQPENGVASPGLDPVGLGQKPDKPIIETPVDLGSKVPFDLGKMPGFELVPFVAEAAIDAPILDSDDPKNFDPDFSSKPDLEDPLAGLTLLALAVAPNESQINSAFNENAAITTRANTLRPGGGLGLDLTGTGFTIGVWDDGPVLSTHQELNGRVTVVDGGDDFSAHATHVAGTIAAAGIVPALQGMASGVNIRSRDWDNDFSELNADAGAGLIQISNHSYGFLTGWLGQLATAAPLLTTPTDFWYEDRANFFEEDPDFGRYSSETRQLDEVLYNNPALLSVWAAGNQGDDQFTGANGNKYLAFLSGPAVGTTLIAPAIYLIDPDVSGLAPPPPDGNRGTGYDSLPSVQTAKNSLVVGAIGNTTWNGDNTIATGGTVLPISSWGATDDGRMKPDLVANGDNLISSLSANNTDSGSLLEDTSSSAASVTGTMVLLHEHHQNLDGLDDPEYENVQNKTGTSTNPRFKTIADPLSSTMKGLGIHTATDIGLTGPDYQSGWGLLNGQSAATFLSDLGDPYQDNPSLLVEDTFDGSPIDIGTVNSNGGEIKVTLIWTDPAPTTLPTRGTNDGNIDDPTSVLVNDLDLYLQDSGGNIYYPWTLDPSNPSLGAVKTTANNRENVEQVVFNATTDGIGAGDYKVYVDGVLDAGYTDQDFSIFFSSVPQAGNGHGWGEDPSPLCLNSIKIEAEAANPIVNYRIENVGVASSGKVLSFLGDGENEQGSVTFDFNGVAGNYDIILGTFDENDGLASFTVDLNDVEIGSLLLDDNLGSNGANAETFVTPTIATGINLTAGDTITLNGFENGGEHARVDFIQFEPNDSCIKIEAEAADTILNYRTENLGGVASGDQVLSFFGDGENEQGNATFSFSGPAGNYDIILGTFDENDGLASFTVDLNNVQIGSLVLNDNLGSNVANTQTFVSPTVATGINLTAGDIITVNGFEDGGEHARFDYIQFRPV